jgi:hypothetical protein
MESMKSTGREIKSDIPDLAGMFRYKLLDKSYLTLPPILKRDRSIIVKGRLKRGFLETGPNRHIEINIWGQGEQDGKAIEIIGEAKTQLKKGDVDKFLQTLKTLGPYISRPIHPLCITYQTSPAVTQYARDKGIDLYFTYELQSE